MLLWPGLRPPLTGVPAWVATLVEAAAAHGPLLAGALLAAWWGSATAGRRRSGRRRLVRALGIQLRGIDLVLGALVALVARAVVEVVAPSGGALSPGFETDPADVAAGVVATIVVVVALSPLVEELFFRGALQRALQAALSGTSGRAETLAAGVAVTLSTVLFVLLHVVSAGATVPVSTVLSALVVGVGAGVLTAVTGRIGAGATAHVLFNAAGVALLLV